MICAVLIGVTTKLKIMKHLLLIIFIGIFKLGFTQTVDEIYAEANAAIEAKDFKLALKKIDQVIKLDAENIDYYGSKAYVLFELERFQDAYDFYNEAILIFPEAASLYNDRGCLLLSFQEFELAAEDFTTAMEYAENDSIKNSAITNRATTKMATREFIGAYQDLMLAYAFDSTNIATLTNLGAITDEIGRGDETLKYLLKAVEVDPDFYPAYGNIGFKYQEMGEHEKAIVYYDKVLAFNPDEPLGYSNRSYNKLKLGDTKGAIKDIDKSIKLYPENSYAYRIRALIYLEVDKPDKACADLQTAINYGFTEMYGEEVIGLQSQFCNR